MREPSACTPHTTQNWESYDAMKDARKRHIETRNVTWTVQVNFFFFKWFFSFFLISFFKCSSQRPKRNVSLLQSITMRFLCVDLLRRWWLPNGLRSVREINGGVDISTKCGNVVATARCKFNNHQFKKKNVVVVDGWQIKIVYFENKTTFFMLFSKK